MISALVDIYPNIGLEERKFAQEASTLCMLSVRNSIHFYKENTPA
jgi:hypothetical protein